MRLLSSLFTTKMSSTRIGLGEAGQFCAQVHKNRTSAGERHDRVCGRKKGVNERKWRGREESRERRSARASERQYRGAVLRASGKRVVSRILWTLHGETTIVTKQTPETQRGRQENKKTSMNWQYSAGRGRNKDRVCTCGALRGLHLAFLFLMHFTQRIYSDPPSFTWTPK